MNFIFKEVAVFILNRMINQEFRKARHAKKPMSHLLRASQLMSLRNDIAQQ